MKTKHRDRHTAHSTLKRSSITPYRVDFVHSPECVADFRFLFFSGFLFFLFVLQAAIIRCNRVALVNKLIVEQKSRVPKNDEVSILPFSPPNVLNTSHIVTVHILSLSLT